MTANEVTSIDVFELSGSPIDELIESWYGLGGYLSGTAGFREARLHRAVSPDAPYQLVNIAHWDSVERWRTALEDAPMAAARAAAGRQATAHPAVYELIGEFSSHNTE